ncbi:MAG TPA: YdeI/OmpD-associated family protein, partial [Bacteroidales bacterium]
LIEERRMQPSGLKEIEAAKKDGRWDKAYDSPSQMEIPADFLALLRKDQQAYEFFKTLNKANTYAVAWRLETAKKPETREKRMQILLEMMKKRQKLH